MGKNKEDLIGGLKRIAKWYLHRGHGGQKFNDNHIEMTIYHLCSNACSNKLLICHGIKIKGKNFDHNFLFSSI